MTHSSPVMPQLPELRAHASVGLAAWLASQPLSVAFTTYRANRLLLLGTGASDSPETAPLRLHERLFDRPMGLFAADESLWMASRCQIWRLDNHLAAGRSHEGGDRLYVPAACFVTGDVNAHELALAADGELVFVNTAFSCLATIQPGSSFAPSWQPPFIHRLAGDDRCHLNGLALKDGVPTWASACGGSDGASSWRHHRDGGGVLIHIPSGELAATGLSMPHSPRWHDGRLWLLNSGTGELGWIEKDHFQPLCGLPGFVRGLAFVAGCAVVGLSKLRSPQFTGLPLEKRLKAEGLPGGCCGLRVIDLQSGASLHSFDLPEPIDELFDVVLLPGVRQPRALGLQGEEIDCLVKIPERPELLRVRPMAPSGNPHRGPQLHSFGLPEPGAAASPPQIMERAVPAPAAASTAIRYQRVFHLTPSNLVPYAALTYPPVTQGGTGLGKIEGELLGLSAMADGVMVALAMAERQPDGGARLLSLMVDPAWRRRGIGSGMLTRLMGFLAKEGVSPLLVRYQRTALSQAALEPMLRRLGWSAPRSEFLLLSGRSDELAKTPWAERHPVAAPYRLIPLAELNERQLQQAQGLEAPRELIPQFASTTIEPTVSLALLRDDALVGWLIVDRTAPDAVRYSSLFVAPGHRARGRAMALLASGFRRQKDAGIPIARGAFDSRNAAMRRVLERHLRPFLSGVGESRAAQVVLPSRPAAAQPTAPGS